MQSPDPGGAIASVGAPTTTNPTNSNSHTTTNGAPQPTTAEGSGPSPFTSWRGFQAWMIKWRGSRQLVLVIVAIALLLDNMLLTVVGEWHTMLSEEVL